VGFERVSLPPGESRALTFTVDDRLLGEFADGRWQVTAGVYRFAAGRSAVDLDAPVQARLGARSRPP
jgi:beta-glucosidase